MYNFNPLWDMPLIILIWTSRAILNDKQGLLNHRESKNYWISKREGERVSESTYKNILAKYRGN